MKVTSMSAAESYLSGLASRQMTYEERLAYVKDILKDFGNPQDATAAIHIAGTSGKGSTAYYCASLLRNAGYTVGLCVSPHVNSVAERAQVNGSPLPDNEYLEYFDEFVREVEQRELVVTYIEFLDVFIYWLFAKLSLDYTVVEVGLGGLLDPTNVMTRPDKTCVITDIGLDHMEILGDTIAEIATQKAGIIHAGNDVVMYRQDNDVTGVVTRVAEETGAQLGIIDNPVRPAPARLPLYQRRNWGLALSAVSARLARDGRPLPNPGDDSATAVTVPGRFEVFTYDDVTVVLDAAHNPQKTSALVDALDDAFPLRPMTYVISLAKNKSLSFAESVAILTKRPGEVIATELMVSFGGGHTALPAEDIVAAAGRGQILRDPVEAFSHAVLQAEGTNIIVVVTGSFYLIDTVRRLLISHQGASLQSGSRMPMSLSY